MDTLVAIGFAEALSAPEVAWSLLDAGFKVVAFSRKGRSAALRHSRLLTVYEITSPEEDWTICSKELSALLSGWSEDGYRQCVLLPIDDASVWLSAPMELPARWTLAGPRGDNARLALDKWEQIRHARTCGFNVPDSFVVSTPAELATYSSRLPLILRPVQAVSKQGHRMFKGQNWICSDASELRLAAKTWNGRAPLLMQPYLRGNGEGVFGFVTTEGVVAWSAHRRLRMMNPHGSGSSACISQEPPREIQEPAEKFVTSRSWRGMFMLELLRQNDGRYWFVEFNGRAWGSMALARRGGFEYPAWAVQLALNSRLSPMPTPAPRKAIECRNIGRELMHLLFILRGPKSRAVLPWPSFWDSLAKSIRFPRGTCLYNCRKGDWRVLLADICYTIRDQIFKRKT